MSENEVAIESTLRNELMDEFVDGLRNLFAEHYINVPESKIDIVESLAEKVDTLETELDEIISENTEMKEILSDVAKKEIFEELIIQSDDNGRVYTQEYISLTKDFYLVF